MSLSADASDFSAPSGSDAAERDLQPFFVLHKASSRLQEGKATGKVKTRRRIELSLSSPKIAKKSEVERVDECDDQFYGKLRQRAFEIVWSNIESTIRGVLRDMNTNIFNEIHRWVCKSFNSIRSCKALRLAEALQPFPILTAPASKQLFTALVLTKNMETVDDQLTFYELSLHLKAQGCHVASLSSSDFLGKNGTDGCLRSLFRQLLTASVDVADISILASWYREDGNDNNPLVVIVEDSERCCGSVMSDLILLMSEWAVKLPVILIMAVATTLDAPKRLLTTKALQRLCPCKFTLGWPTGRMDAVIEAVLVKQCSSLAIGHKLALFLRNYFLYQDGTLTSFVRALKIACAKHFFTEPLSFTLQQFHEGQIEVSNEDQKLLMEAITQHVFESPSLGRNVSAQNTCQSLVHGMSELKRLQNRWSLAFLCLYEAGKYDKFQLLDLYCEALDPETYYLRTSRIGLGSEKDTANSPSSVIDQQPGFLRGSFISRVFRRLRDLSAAQLTLLLKRWENFSGQVPEIHEKVKEVQHVLQSLGGASLRQELTGTPKKHISRGHSKFEKEVKAIAEKVVALLEFILRDMQPIESITFHELVCFKSVDELQSALIGDPRRSIQVDLLESHKIIKCRCCSRKGNILLPSMHDTSIMYTLAQEHGDLINLHDWYQSFKAIVLCKGSKGKQKLKQSPTPKKRKDQETESPTDAAIQARFCRAVAELQLAGLVRMPSKRRPDSVQRVAFGI